MSISYAARAGLAVKQCRSASVLCKPRYSLKHLAAPRRRPQSDAADTVDASPYSGGARRSVVGQAMMTPKAIFSAGTGIVLLMYALMGFAPRARVTRKIAQSPLLDLALLGLYAAAMWHCWQEGIVQQVFAAVQASVPTPDLVSLSALCKTSAFSSLCWIHLLMLDLYMARAVLIDGIKCMVKTTHSVLLCFMFGPTGLLSHILTKAVWGTGPSKHKVA